MNISLNSLNKFFNRFYLAGFLILSMGIPLTFSSLTRSVFEVNKLLLLRIVIIIIYGAWILKSCLLKDNQLTPPTKYSYKILGFSWRRIGLEIPILLWIITNLISIIFSENIFVGYIGAYDRWESLATILNYVLLFYMTAKLIDSTRYRLLIFSICVFSTSISSVYGVIQSLGVDFMNWSRSPTDRVFACINNPVHFCAYVGMTVLIGIGLMFYSLNNLSKKALSFTTSNAVVYTSIVSLILVLCSFLTFNSLPSLIFTVLFALGAYALYFYTTIKPTKTNIVHFSLFGLVFLSTRLLGLYTLDRFQTTALIFGLIILYCISAIKNKYLLYYRIITVCTMLLFYSMILSFSRATLVGFVVSISFLFQCLLQDRKKLFSVSKLICLLIATTLISLTLIFKIYYFGTIGVLLSVIVLLASFLLLLYSSESVKVFSIFPIVNKNTCFLLFSFMATFLPFLNYSLIQNHSLLFAIPYLLIYLYFKQTKATDYTFYKNNIVIALIFNLCFNFISFSNIILFFTHLFTFYFLYIKPNLKSDESINTTTVLVGFSCLTLLPTYVNFLPTLLANSLNFFTLPHFINYLGLFLIFVLSYFLAYTTFNKKYFGILIFSFLLILGIIYAKNSFNISISGTSQQDTLKVSRHITSKMKNVSNNNARLYMWLSVPAWVADYPLFGSGPDTTRCLYPTYRHPDYGFYEGGHNYTPDRLHNEYLNTITTKGIIGFVIKYILFFGSWYLILFRLYKKYQLSSKHYIIAGIIAGPTIYLIQVLFNFGVVATLFLFYFLLGIGLSFVNDEYQKTT